MLRMELDAVLTLNDLRSLNVECGECHSAITLALDGNYLRVSNCPACHKPFDDQMVGHISALAQIFQQRRSAKHPFTFRVRVKRPLSWLQNGDRLQVQLEEPVHP